MSAASSKYLFSARSAGLQTRSTFDGRKDVGKIQGAWTSRPLRLGRAALRVMLPLSHRIGEGLGVRALVLPHPLDVSFHFVDHDRNLLRFQFRVHRQGNKFAGATFRDWE